MSTNFWDKQAKKYDKSTNKVFGEANKRIVRNTKKYCDLNMQMLDIGCGTGLLTLPMSKYVKHIDAIDFSEKMLLEAKNNSQQMKVNNIEWINNCIEQVDLNNNYNIITAFNVLLYVDDIEKFLKDVYNRMDDNGYFISVTDCYNEKKSILNPMTRILIRLGVIPKMHFFSVNELTSIIKRAGFSIIEEENVHYSQVNYYVVAKKIL